MTDDMEYTVFYTDENGQLVPNGEKLLSITEIAKYRNIPTERLRYYDKIGLLRPDYVDKLTGRRFYSAQQCEKLGTIKELRRLNLSLKEIEDYFSDRNLEKSERVLRQRYELLQQEIADKLEISRVLKEKLKFIRELNNTDFKLDDPIIKELPERYALKGESNKFRTNLTGIEFMKLEEAIGGTSPVLATDKVAMTIKTQLILTIWIPRSVLWCSARQIRLTRKASQQWQEENTFALFTGIATAISVSL